MADWITEQETLAAIPPSGFIHDYVCYAMLQTTAPLLYHIGVGLSILAVTTPPTMGIRYAGVLRPNAYTMLVGRSGEDQKSTALSIGREILFEAAPGLIGDDPGSPEGLVDSLSVRSTQILHWSELGKLLAHSKKGYLEPLKTLLTDLYDCSPQQRAKANNNVIRVDAPRLTVMGGCSTPYLEKHTDAGDWTGGFLRRWLILYGRRERLDPDPKGDPRGKPALVQALVDRAAWKGSGQGLALQAGWCDGLDKPATKLWHDWFHAVYKRQLPDLIAGVRTSAPTIARKIALLYGWDFGKARSNKPWTIGLAELEPAIALAELHLRGVVMLAERLAPHEDAKIRRMVLEAFPSNGAGCATTIGHILTATKLRKRLVVEVMDGLESEGLIERYDVTGGQTAYLRVGSA